MQNQTRNILLASAMTFALAGAAEAQGARPARYADGVYMATGEYGGQPSHITVKATLKDGVITAVTVMTHAFSRQGREDAEDAETAPSYEAVVERLVRPVILRRVLSLQAMLDDINDAADYPPVIDTRHPVR